MYLLISQATNTPYQIFTPVLFVPFYASHFAVDGTLFLITPTTHASYSKVVISSHGLLLKMLDCERSANQCGNNFLYRWCPFDDQSHLLVVIVDEAFLPIAWAGRLSLNPAQLAGVTSLVAPMPAVMGEGLKPLTMR